MNLSNKKKDDKKELIENIARHFMGVFFGWRIQNVSYEQSETFNAFANRTEIFELGIFVGFLHKSRVKFYLTKPQQTYGMSELESLFYQCICLDGSLNGSMGWKKKHELIFSAWISI